MRATGINCGFFFPLPALTLHLSEPKMLRLGSLVVLCGLLIGTSESLLGGLLGNTVNNVNALNPSSGGELIQVSSAIWSQEKL